MNKFSLYPDYISTVPPLEQCSEPPWLSQSVGNPSPNQPVWTTNAGLGHTAHLFLTSDNDQQFAMNNYSS